VIRPPWQMPQDVRVQNASTYRGDRLGRADRADSPYGTACNMCGACCEVVHPATDRPALMAMLANPYIVGAMRRQAEIVVGLLDAKVSVDRGRPGYTCRHFDTETRKCGIYADRPDMCRGYPWYDREPKQDAFMPEQCSFQADLRKRLPIVAVT